MSYASRFTSNRFAALAEDYTAPAPPVATRTWEPDTGAAAAARSALSTSSEYKSPSNIFRRGNTENASPQMPGAFQGMRSGGGGWQQATGYRGLHNSSSASVAAAAAPPPPKLYEDEFPSLGGKSTKATTAPRPKKAHEQNFANLAKSWATTTAEEEAVAAAQRAEEEKQAQRKAYDNDIYHKLMIRRAAAAAASASAYEEPDYNDEFYPNQEPLSHDEYEGRPYSPHSPHYSGNLDEEEE
jgi:hypothetical protein